MTFIRRFEDIEAWQKGRHLCKKIREVTNIGDFQRDLSLKDQIRRSSGSIMDNIAEGFGRDGNREFIQYLSCSKGSANEVQSQLYRALDCRYINNWHFMNIHMNI
ncbi:MAG: four helix bundle protein [Marinilabiliaceae bacterium]